MTRSNRSLHQKLEEDLRKKIISGEWSPDTMISSENELAAQYGISRMTARTAITHLVGAGLLYRIAGKGTFVAAPVQIPRTASYVCIRDQLDQAGMHIEKRVLLAEERECSAKVADTLELPHNSNVYYVESIRITDSEPIYISRAYFSPAICPDYFNNDFETRRTADLLKDKYGITTSHVKETLRSTVASFEEAGHLNVIPGYPLLYLTETLYDQLNRPYSYSQMVFRGDKLMLTFDFIKNET